MKKGILYLLLASLGLLSACQNSESSSSGSAEKKEKYRVLPDSHGGTLDLIVVAKDPVWEGMPGELIRKYYTQMQYGLPQPEPRFVVNQVDPSEYNDLLKRSRYQILLTQGDSALELKTNQYAKNQLLAYYSAPDEIALAKMIAATQEDLRKTFREKDLNRISSRIKSKLRFNTSDVLAQNHIELGIPRGYDLEVEEPQTLLYWKKTAAQDLGILVHFRPMPQEQTLMGEKIVPVRDSLTKLYVQGERNDAYMVTEDLLKPQLTAMELAGQFAMEARGLWRMEGDILGGPFLSYTIYDEEHAQIIYLDAFIFAPDQKKRNTLFELEAILRGVEIL